MILMMPIVLSMMYIASLRIWFSSIQSTQDGKIVSAEEPEDSKLGII
jgi:hypothetical protein